jgi:hypothetical protein
LSLLEISSVTVHYLRLPLKSFPQALQWGDYVIWTGIARSAITCIGDAGQTADYRDFGYIPQREQVLFVL